MPVRTTTLKVAEIIEGGTKGEFYKDLRKACNLARRVANLSITEVAIADKLGVDAAVGEKVNVYQKVSHLNDGGCARQISSIVRNASGMYFKKRKDIRSGAASVPSIKRQGWPLLHNKSNKTMEIELGKQEIFADMSILGRKWRVKFANGKNWRRSHRAVRNSLKFGDSRVRLNKDGIAMVDVACHVEERDYGLDPSIEMKVSSSTESLAIATSDSLRSPYVITGDDFLQRKAKTQKKYQRLRQDKKPGSQRRQIAKEMLKLAAKERDWTKNYTHVASRSIINKAISTGCGKLTIDFTIKSAAKSFPWHELTAQIKHKAEISGIAVADITIESKEPNLDCSHIYFKYSPLADLVKIGMTEVGKGRHEGVPTDSPDENLTILAIQNTAKSKLREQEKFFHAYFSEHRKHGEWFNSSPVLQWLREAGWLGNAGNLSQILQVLPESKDNGSEGHL